jgi:3-mercaptopyruvate sulfurtransferase SseA
MRLCISLTAILLCAILSPAACNSKRESKDSIQSRSSAQGSSSTAAQEATPSDGVRRVSLAELREALEKGEAVIIDVRGPVEYELGHIKGARSLPLGLIAQRVAELPRDKLIVTYCA